MNGLLDKFNGIFNKDKFDTEIRNALKRGNFTLTAKSEDGVYDITNGTATFSIDTSKERKAYEKSHSDQELAAYIKKFEKECDMESRMVSFTNGQVFLRFIIMRSENVTDKMVSADFTDGLKKVVVYTADDENLHFLNESCLRRWVVPKEVAVSVADRNMCKILNKSEINQSELVEGIKILEFNIPSKRLTAGLMMCNEFRKTIYKHMGSKFLVVAPSEENLLVLENITNDILEKLGSVVVKEYQKAEHPLTTDVMLFTPNDIQIAGRFSFKTHPHADEVGKSLN